MLSLEPRLTIALAPGSATANVSGWQAIFSFRWVADLDLTIEGRFVVDANCLDLFTEGLGSVLDVCGPSAPH